MSVTFVGTFSAGLPIRALPAKGSVAITPDGGETTTVDLRSDGPSPSTTYGSMPSTVMEFADGYEVVVTITGTLYDAAAPYFATPQIHRSHVRAIDGATIDLSLNVGSGSQYTIV